MSDEVKLTPKEVVYTSNSAFCSAQEAGVIGKECEEWCDQAVADAATLKAQRHYEPIVSQLQYKVHNLRVEVSRLHRRLGR